jgi:3-carboxy-cis,cis-muconate cycloisomerase
LQELRPRVLVLQFGGAVGTLASLGSKGLEVTDLLAAKLHLRLPSLPWHSHRDRIAEVGTCLALLTGTLGKIARDISLMMQTEVGEVAEPAAEGRGGSSTMPQKRNPVLCTEILAAASQVPALACTLLTAMPQEHERGVGGWQSEWEVVPHLIRRAGGALRRARVLIEGLVVDSTRMRENLALTQGLIFAEAITMMLARQIGKPAAHKLVEEAARNAIASKKHLREVLAKNPEFSARVTPGELDSIFDPSKYLGAANEYIDRTIASHKAETGER